MMLEVKNGMRLHTKRRTKPNAVSLVSLGGYSELYLFRNAATPDVWESARFT